MRFRAHSRAELIAVYARDALEGGAFIRTRPVPPLQPGTRVAFRFELQDGREVMSGIALVAWLQREEGRAGVGLHFLSLSAEGQQLQRQMNLARLQRDRVGLSQQTAADEFCDVPTSRVRGGRRAPPPLPPLPRAEQRSQRSIRPQRSVADRWPTARHSCGRRVGHADKLLAGG